jgi:hypothetical protein
LPIRGPAMDYSAAIRCRGNMLTDPLPSNGRIRHSINLAFAFEGRERPRKSSARMGLASVPTETGACILPNISQKFYRLQKLARVIMIETAINAEANLRNAEEYIILKLVSRSSDRTV